MTKTGGGGNCEPQLDTLESSVQVAKGAKAIPVPEQSPGHHYKSTFHEVRLPTLSGKPAANESSISWVVLVMGKRTVKERGKFSPVCTPRTNLRASGQGVSGSPVGASGLFSTGLGGGGGGGG